jgi:hypothetical protein
MERVIDCCLTQSQLAISLDMVWWEQVTFWWDVNDVCFLQDKHAKLEFYSAILNQQPTYKYCNAAAA